MRSVSSTKSHWTVTGTGFYGQMRENIQYFGCRDLSWIWRKNRNGYTEPISTVKYGGGSTIVLGVAFLPEDPESLPVKHITGLWSIIYMAIPTENLEAVEESLKERV